MNDIGNFCLQLALTLTVFGFFASLLYSIRAGRCLLGELARRSVFPVLGLVSASSVSLFTLLLSSDFNNLYVWKETTRALPWYYKLSAFWAGQEGSLLLWSWILVGFASVFAFMYRTRSSALLRWSFTILLGNLVFFLILNNFQANPFQQLFEITPEGPAPIALEEGTGLNPQLQHPMMIFHPVTLYVGFIGMVIPYSLALGSILCGLRKGSFRPLTPTLSQRKREPFANSLSGRGCAEGPGEGSPSFLKNPHDSSTNLEEHKSSKGAEESTSFDCASENREIEWLRLMRPWLLFTWVFLLLGNLLGMVWAYEELGWGGYWAWDPVENASLLPLLTATALLHTVWVQRTRGYFPKWNLLLALVTYLLCILGTFITRSGIIASVHAFGKSPIGGAFAVFLGILSGVSLILFGIRIGKKQHVGHLETWFSREGLLHLASLVLVLTCGVVLYGTLHPLVAEVFTGRQEAMEPIYYNRVSLPMGLLLALGLGICPWASWKRSFSKETLRKILLPLTVSVLAILFLLVSGRFSVPESPHLGIHDGIAREEGRIHVPAALMVGVSLFLLASVIPALVGRIWKSGLRVPLHSIGAGIAHVGLGLMLIGFAGAAFDQEWKGSLREGETVIIPLGELRLESIREFDTPLIALGYALDMTLRRNGDTLARLEPRMSLFSQDLPRTEEDVPRWIRDVGRWGNLWKDVYVVFRGFEGDTGNEVAVSVQLLPLVRWVWYGGILLLLGGSLAFVGAVKNGKGEMA